ncbi:hypothetical protein RB195_014281 [Necator americanus]|uniref:Uncharacterized protein n=1 Tax=Necator americanus TaxID=51031 RepID=A0ABR1DZS3_NECAM
MDSPSDLSPNAPPSGFDESNNYFSNLQAPPAPPSSSSTGQASTEGSVDSSGFEKVDHDVLEEYGQQFVNEMQQSLFGKPLEADSSVNIGIPFERGSTRSSAVSTIAQSEKTIASAAALLIARNPIRSRHFLSNDFVPLKRSEYVPYPLTKNHWRLRSTASYFL